MIDVSEALTLLDARISALETQRLPLERALRRVSSREVVSGIDLPPFTQSAMDGYAVRSADLAGASARTPVHLRRVGEVAAGYSAALPWVGAGAAARIFTGARVPPGADAVLRQELAKPTAEGISVQTTLDAGRDIRPAGVDLNRGSCLVGPGTRLDERHIAMLSTCGLTDIEVRRQPAITLLVSGNEVVQPGRELRPGEVYDANTAFLAGWLQMRGYDRVKKVALPDNPQAVTQALEGALAESDLVLSTGGVSVGDYDFFNDVAADIGMETVFWRVAQRPGKPLLFATRDQTPFLGIPGNPGAVFVCAYVYLRRILDRLEGVEPPGPQMRSGVLAREVAPSAHKTSWLSCTLRFNEQGQAQLDPVGGYRLGKVYRADAIARVAPGPNPHGARAAVDWFNIT
jgi:molybdopterin molybdotransferase